MSCSLSDSPFRRRLLDDVRERVFSPARPGGGPRFGAEVEFIPWDARLMRAMPILDDGEGRGSLALLREHARRRGWRVVGGPHGAPRLHLPGGGRIDYEPGGQIEYASPPHPTPDDLLDDLDGVVPPLIDAAREAGIELLSVGIDPRTPLADVPPRLPGERYVALHRYLSAIGDAGPRMMLQTAAVQINIELADARGEDAVLRWRVLNAAAPYLTAMFANSRVYAGEDSGYASYRARQWRMLDRRRTGLLGRGPDAAGEYLDFALNAGWIFAPADREPEPFVEWLLRGEVTLDDWRWHLSTLFPEIRPRGFLEIRCIDALPPAWYAAPLALVAGLLADPRTLREAAEVVGAPDSMLLQDAARAGLRHPALRRGAVDLVRLALPAASRAGVVGDGILEPATGYFEAYTARGRTPADERVGVAA